MKNLFRKFLYLFFLPIILIGMITGRIFAQQPSDTTSLILVNQIGFTPSAVKIALVKANVRNFEVREAATGKLIFSSSLGKPGYWSFSGDTVRIADFSQVTQPGKYRVCILNNTVRSPEFSIGADVYHALSCGVMKAFYYNRASFEITPQYGGKWARAAGHPDTAVLIHESAASMIRPAGTKVSSPGGWYDAGDYNKYVVNSGITTYTLLLFDQLYNGYCKTLDLNIPESNNNIPDEVDELLYNLKWMLTMQDPNDGGVYHKLTNKSFDPFVMPDKATQPRYMVQKSTAAALDFVSVMAMASRVLAKEENKELKTLAGTCLKAAGKAMTWAKANPKAYYRQPADIHTGEYADTVLKDEFFWANVELALASKDKSLVSTKDIAAQDLITPSWDHVEMLGLISLSLSDDPAFKELRDAASKRLLTFTDKLVDKYKASAYRVSLVFFKWGSNSDVANQAVLKLVAYRITGNREYLPSIQGDLDYLLGKNATGYCFVTGFGTLSPRNIHHRPSASDGVPEPVPGFMAGGPNTMAMYDCGNMVTRSLLPAKSYKDAQCSYSTNEIAINWNAPLFFLVGAMDAMPDK